MVRFLKLALVTLAVGAPYVAGTAEAQGVMTPGAMPPPPSLRESAKPTDRRTQTRRASRPTQTEPGTQSEADAPRRPLRATTTTPRAPQEGSVSSRVDDRPQRAQSRGMQLEDDPRGVAPVFNNGRPGVGMRF
jgi:hypothetical protein